MESDRSAWPKTTRLKADSQGLLRAEAPHLGLTSMCWNM